MRKGHYNRNCFICAFYKGGYCHKQQEDISQHNPKNSSCKMYASEKLIKKLSKTVIGRLKDNVWYLSITPQKLNTALFQMTKVLKTDDLGNVIKAEFIYGKSIL